MNERKRSLKFRPSKQNILEALRNQTLSPWSLEFLDHISSIDSKASGKMHQWILHIIQAFPGMGGKIAVLPLLF